MCQCRVVDGKCFVVEAVLSLNPETDPASVGAAVTVELCGHWDHAGPCRWPHNNAVDVTEWPARFRTLYVADTHESDLVAGRISAALGSGSGWRLVEVGQRAVKPAEAALAGRLLSGPRTPAVSAAGDNRAQRARAPREGT